MSDAPDHTNATIDAIVLYEYRLHQAREVLGPIAANTLHNLAKELEPLVTRKLLNCLEVFMQIEQEFPGQSENIWASAKLVLDEEPTATPWSALEYVIKALRIKSG